MEELGFEQSEPITLRIDSTGAASLAKNRMISQQTKHIDIKYHYIRDIIESNQLILEHVASEDNVADIFTKPLSALKFIQFREQMGIRKIDT